MRVARAMFHLGRRGYDSYITIGENSYSLYAFVNMWNEVPPEIRKEIQEKEEFQPDY